MPSSRPLLFSVVIFLAPLYTMCIDQHYYLVDIMGRTFDGIGGISGGGATSKLLPSYESKFQSNIFDLLFKPKYAASLQILKVEIGGDSQSTQGTEASHMHNPQDLNFQRGYEWFIMSEAKKRNPSIRLYGLPWTFPGWLADSANPLRPYSNVNATVVYTMNWLLGAKIYYGLDIDYIGIWNERECNYNYIKLLKMAIVKAGLSTRIVACDGGWGMERDVLLDKELARAIDILGSHYPGAHTPQQAVATGKPLWASEEYSAYNDDVGAGCWARVITESFVLGNLTSMIAWNMLNSYLDGLPYPSDSLMNANQPWSGHFSAAGPLWITAHITQFTEIGWTYLAQGAGSGALSGGGFYVTLVSPDMSDITIVISTMRPSQARCFYGMPDYNVTDSQNVTFVLPPRWASLNALQMWVTDLDLPPAHTPRSTSSQTDQPRKRANTFEHHTVHTSSPKTSQATSYFAYRGPLAIMEGRFSLTLPVNSLITLSTVRDAQHAALPNDIPPPAPFPTVWLDDFDSSPLYSEATFLTPQAGTLEVLPAPPSQARLKWQKCCAPPCTCYMKRRTRLHSQASTDSVNQAAVQTVPQQPVDTCYHGPMLRPIALGGNVLWRNVTIGVDFLLELPPSYKHLARYLPASTKRSTRPECSNQTLFSKNVAQLRPDSLTKMYFRKPNRHSQQNRIQKGKQKLDLKFNGNEFQNESPLSSCVQPNFADGVLIAARVPFGSCELHANTPYGIYLYLYANSTWEVYRLFNKSMLIERGSYEYRPFEWMRVKLSAVGPLVEARVNSRLLFSRTLEKLPAPVPGAGADAAYASALPQENGRKLELGEQGFVGLGTNTYGLAFFDNLNVRSLDSEPLR